VEEMVMIKPSLEPRPVIRKLSEIPQGGSSKAGFLVDKNSGWRNRTPRVDVDKCVGCLQCYMYCPDGVIRKNVIEIDGKSVTKVDIDYDFCKGCGICEKMCQIGAISMEEKSE
jgi:pyruvate ferredoxin oxidoreductase delta subunit/pyruvate ferredoxin oxidoreductase gamma subunit